MSDHLFSGKNYHPPGALDIDRRSYKQDKIQAQIAADWNRSHPIVAPRQFGLLTIIIAKLGSWLAIQPLKFSRTYPQHTSH